MDEALVVLGMLAFFAVIGLVMFIPLRWLFMRGIPDKESLPKAPRQAYLIAAILFAVLLPIWWFMSSGSKTAGLVYLAVIALVQSISLVLLKRRRVANKRDDT